MPHTKSTAKRVKTNAVRRLRNRASKSKLATILKKLYSIEDKGIASKFLTEVISLIDKSAKKGILHKNKAARKKSQVSTYVNNLA